VIDPLARRLLDTPDDVATRHVWADALAARGDPHGELVQLQLLERPTPAQAARTDELLAALRARLKKLGVERFLMTGGRMLSIVIGMRSFLDRVEDILAAAPLVEDVSLDFVNAPGMMELARHLTQLRGLGLLTRLARVPSSGAHALVGADLRSLALTGRFHGVDALLRLERLEQLVLQYNQLGPRTMDALARAQLPRLAHLRLSACQLTGRVLERLATARIRPRRIDLSMNRLSPVDFEQLAPLLESAEVLDLYGADVTPAEHEVLARRFPKLHVVTSS
jgi:uncharacterized protein (TIGR02996 family)